MANSGTTFTISDINVHYAGKQVLTNISASIFPGQSLAIAGANGAGKTSLMGALAGLIPCTGSVSINHIPLAPNIQARLQAGIRLVPEHRKIYPTLSVTENLIVGERSRGEVGIDDVYQWFPRLAERRRTLGGNLSGGEQQMLAIGMAILGSPKILLLDEPTLGLSVPVIHDLSERLSSLRKALNLTVIVSESDATWLRIFSESALVLDRGMQVGRIDDYSIEKIKQIESLMVGLETV